MIFVVFSSELIAELQVTSILSEAGRRMSGAPPYPVFLRNMNLEGSVRLRVTVAPNGTPKSSQVLGGNPAFAKAAQDAVADWKWGPALEQSEVLVNLVFHP